MQKKKIGYAVFVVLIAIVLTFSFSLTGCTKSVAKETTAAATTVEETTAAVTTVEETTAAVTTVAEPVELIFWMPVAQDDPHIALFEEINKHMAEKYNISVKFEGQSMDAWAELLTTAGMSQTGPDLLFNWSGLGAVIDGGKKNLYQPLNDILPAGMYDQVAGWGGTTDSDGKIYAVAYDLSFAGLAFNKSLFDKAGIDYSSYPKLSYWDEFIDTCKKLKDAGITPIGFANKEGYYGEWWLASTMPSYFDSNEEMAKYFQTESMNTQPMLDALAKYKTLYDEGYFLKEGLTLDHTNNTQQEFISEKVAMQYSSPLYYKTYAEALGADKVGINFWVNFSNEGKLAKNMTGTYSHVIGVTPWTKYPDQAVLVLQELCATEWGSGKINEILGETPSYKGWKPKAETPTDWTTFVQSAVDLLSKGEAGMYAYDTWPTEFGNAVYKFNGLFLSGDMTAEEFAKELDAARGIQ